MSLETGTYISDLVSTNPLGSDAKSAGDDHIRLLKSTIKASFTGVTGAVTATHTELNYAAGLTSAAQTQITAEVNRATAAESAEQARALAAEALRAPKANPTFTGTVTVPTPSASTDASTKAYVDGVAMSTSLPGQAGNAGKLISTDGSLASWTMPAAISTFNQLNFGGY